ncbi:MAG: hypothetical protein LBG48_04305 [Rickettsiales bacterium]|jgi:cell division protein FtsB|nr:hypothetical protein [Rickettsiales bacterium]
MESRNVVLWLVLKITLNLMITAYCITHVFTGKYGYIAYHNSDKDLAQKQSYYESHLKKNNKKKNKITQLSRTSLDLDLLKEELKKNTPIVEKNEIIIFSNDFKK